MPPRRLVVLAVATLVLVAAAIGLVRTREPPPAADRAPLLPGLAGAAVDTIRIIGAGNRVLVSLRRDAGRFTVRERGDFPADAARIAALLDSLGALASDEPKTRDPERYAALGVEDVAEPRARGLRIEVAAGDRRWSLVVGRVVGRHVFVRIAAAPQSHLAAPGLAVERDPAVWLERRLLDLRAARIAAIDVTPAYGPGYRLARPQPDDAHFRFMTLPRGRELYDAAIGDPQAALLERFTIADVATAPTAAARVERARFTTYDGLTVELEGRRDADLARVAVAASAAPTAAPAVRAEAERIDGLARGRWFSIGSNQHDLLFKPLDNFLK